MDMHAGFVWRLHAKSIRLQPAAVEVVGRNVVCGAFNGQVELNPQGVPMPSPGTPVRNT